MIKGQIVKARYLNCDFQPVLTFIINIMWTGNHIK